MSADQALEDSGSGQDRSERDEAVEFLRDVLSDGPVPAKDIQRSARELGIAHRTLRRAKTELKVRADREGYGSDGKWLWILPEAAHRCPPPIDDPQDIKGGPLKERERIFDIGGPLSKPKVSTCPPLGEGGHLSPDDNGDGGPPDESGDRLACFEA